MGPGSVVRTVSCHAAGEVGDVIVGGVDPPPGDTIWGIGFVIMEPMHTPPMSGSNAMCVATVVLETGIVEMTEPTTSLLLEAPAGLVHVEASCRDGKVEQVTITNVASFADRLDATIEIDGIGSLRVDTAFGGDSFVLVDAADLGFALEPSEAAEIAELGQRITAAANEQLGFSHPSTESGLEWDHISFCQIAGELDLVGGEATMSSTTVIDPGKLDRSPTGTGLSARLAVLVARGLLGVGDRLVMRSIIDSTFVGTVTATALVGDRESRRLDRRHHRDDGEPVDAIRQGT